MSILLEKIKKYGVKNVMFMIYMRPLHTIMLVKYTSSNDEPVLVPTIIVEDRYKLDTNYKIELRCLYEGFGKQSFYISDLTRMIRDGHALMMVNEFPEVPNSFLRAQHDSFLRAQHETPGGGD